MASVPTKNTIKILEHSHVSPPPGSVPPTQIPLTFFDHPWLMMFNPQVLFFYQLPKPTQHFTQIIIPNLKTSLSLTLRHFFPLAANLLLPPPPQKPYLLYSGDNFVSLTVAESSADFNHLIANYARDVKELHPFVPKLSHAASQAFDKGPTYALSVFALQVTIFPNYGLCIGYKTNHVVTDGTSITHFMKSWGSICKNMTCLDDALISKHVPWHDRNVIKEPSELNSIYHLEPNYSRVWNNMDDVLLDADLTPLEGMLRATFSISRVHIERLKAWVSANIESPQTLRVSSFAVACAFTWFHLVQSHALAVKSAYKDGDYDTCYFPILVDCRSRKSFDFLIPATYFGNCLVMCNVEIKRSELVRENGIFAAAKTIATRIQKWENEALRCSDEWIVDVIEASKAGNIMTVAGSPNLRLYDVDFGWGRPKKTEMVHIDMARNISVSESRDEEGGIEIGVALYKNKLETFAASFKQGLKAIDERKNSSAPTKKIDSKL